MSLRMPSLVLLVALMASGAAQQAAAQSQFHPNSQKYSDAGAKPASGRSGSASLEARALLDQDGAATVEASTGSLEAGTAPGQIRKVQIKVFSSVGKLQYTDNADGSGAGVWSQQLPGLGRNQVVQLQANVGGIDGSRNDVVTVSTQVKRRPDVAVDAVTAPAKALAGAIVNVTATVSEKNGDVGARATCVLSVDGSAITDQATGIWVDAGQTVSCAFQTRFTALGVHQLKVYVTGVSPADWDLSNNAATTSIEILSPETPLNYTASFTGSNVTYHTHTKTSSSDGQYIDEKTEDGTRLNRSLSLTATTTADRFVFPVRLHRAASSSGSIFDQIGNMAYQASSSYPGADCSTLFQDGVYVSVCNYTSGTPRSQIDLTSNGGRVTYFGTVFYKDYGMTGYAYNYSGDGSTGVGGYPVGSSLNAVLELTDASGKLYSARPAMTITSTPTSSKYGSCFRNPRTGVTMCSDGTTTGVNLSGSASR